MDDSKYRELAVCPGCGKPKDVGCVVCWSCFKYRQDVVPLKYFDGYVEEWLKMVRFIGIAAARTV